jgi:hypothetical protein
MAHINTENKVDALILSRRASQNQNSQNTATLKEALHEFIDLHSPKRLGIRRNTDVQRNA